MAAWVTPSWYNGQQSPSWTFRKGRLLGSRYDTRPLETQMVANSVLSNRQQFWSEYVGIKHFNHLLAVLQRYHQVQTNMAGDKIAGLNVQWNFPSKQVCIDMRSYVNNLLLNLNWLMPKKPQLSLLTAKPIAYGQKKQFTPDEDTSAPLSPDSIKRIQKIIGSLLYYAQAVDNKLLVALNAISTQQAKATIHMEQLVETLLNYFATYPNNGIVYRASDMVLAHMQIQATSTKLDRAAEQVHTSSSQKMIHHHISTVQSSQ